MLELKTAFEKQGFKNVLTYINSGNVIFDSKLNATAVKAAKIKHKKSGNLFFNML